nr:MAG TPA: hypothetical protein [Caudoviricetes sp.]
MKGQRSCRSTVPRSTSARKPSSAAHSCESRPAPPTQCA